MPTIKYIVKTEITRYSSNSNYPEIPINLSDKPIIKEFSKEIPHINREKAFSYMLDMEELLLDAKKIKNGEHLYYFDEITDEIKKKENYGIISSEIEYKYNNEEESSIYGGVDEPYDNASNLFDEYQLYIENKWKIIDSEEITFYNPFENELESFTIITTPFKQKKQFNEKEWDNILNYGEPEITLEPFLQLGECQTIEFKSSLLICLKSNKKESYVELSCMKTIAAFLNSSKGGVLFIGVSNNAKIIGLEKDISISSNSFDKLLLRLDNLIDKYLGNEIFSNLEIVQHSYDEREVIIIKIKPFNTPVYLTEQGELKFYIRRSSSTINCNIKEAVTFIKNRF